MGAPSMLADRIGATIPGRCRRHIDRLYMCAAAHTAARADPEGSPAPLLRKMVNLMRLVADRGAVGASIAAGDIRARREPPDNLAAAKGAQLRRHDDLMAP